MALCRITGTLYIPSGEPAASYVLYLARLNKNVVADYGGAVVPDVVRVPVGRDGSVDFEILTGTYYGIARPCGSADGFGFNFAVPNAPNASFSMCIDALPPDPPPPAWLQLVEDAVASSEAALELAEEAETSAAAALTTAQGAETAANAASSAAATADGKAVAAMTAAGVADGKAVAAMTASGVADGKADDAMDAAAVADGKAVVADGKAASAQRAAGVTPYDFGAVGDGVANDTAAISAAFGSGKLVRGAGGTYRTTTTVTAPAGANIEGVSLVYDGAAEGVVMRLLGSRATMSDCRIDGGNKAAWGIIDTTGGSTITGCEVLNIRSETGSAIGIQSAGTGGTKITHNKIHHVHSVGNDTTGDANGAARGIQIYANADLLLPCDVGWNDVWQITGEEGDGIHVLCISGLTFYSSAMTNIHNNTIWDCSKRCIKNQSSDARIAENSTRLTIAGGYSCIDCIDGANSVVSGNRAIVEVTGGRGVQFNGYAPAGVRLSGGQVLDNYIRTFPGEAAIALNVRVVDDVEIYRNTFVHGRMTADTADRLTVSGNRIIGMIASGSDGGISLRVTSLSCDVSDNTMSGGDAYTCVRVDGTGCKVTGNRNRSIVSNAASACYITGAGNTIIGNINAKAAVPVIRYGGSVTEVNQISIANNVTMS